MTEEHQIQAPEGAVVGAHPGHDGEGECGDQAGPQLNRLSSSMVMKAHWAMRARWNVQSSVMLP